MPLPIQFATLPYVVIGGRIEVCLITSRKTGRWLTPKGWPQTSLAPRELAALEAFEEAGLKGEIGKKPIGRYSYVKQRNDGDAVECEVQVFPLLVDHQVVDWPEKGEREVVWVQREQAAEMVDNAGLAELILRFDERCAKAGSGL